MTASHKKFLENDDGVHLMHGEFTMCGDSFDIAETEPNDNIDHLSETKKRTVTCPKCIAVIDHCRYVRTKG